MNQKAGSVTWVLSMCKMCIHFTRRGIVCSVSLSLSLSLSLSVSRKTSVLMGSMLGDWPSRDPHNFSLLRPSDPSSPSKMTPATYHPTHNRTTPPPDQVITTESKNILLRHIYQRADEKLRPKRAASEHLLPEHGCKQLKASVQDTSY